MKNFTKSLLTLLLVFSFTFIHTVPVTGPVDGDAEYSEENDDYGISLFECSPSLDGEQK